ncbi:MAG: DNA/RNA non-specific endonuclease, partial [Fimbriimonadaceae bacterium]|nr:DNA/RNA non-specific endonuclease [Chitinophagales bacterium]
SQRENENAFVKELMQKNVQLTTQEFEKMMDELNKNIQSRYGYRKNKEYEGSDNVAPMRDGLTIQIPITIEFGTNGNISVNALSKEQLDKDIIAENKTPLPVSSGGEIFTEVMVVDPDYTIRTGYDKYFISIGKRKLNLSLPKLSVSLAKKVAPLISNVNESELKYFHYSVVMHKERRMAIYTAVNLDGKEYVEIKRKDQGGKGKWFIDPRMDALYQLNDDLYEKNKLDRGHLVTRTNPNWGTKSLAGKSNNDTFHHTNACPQHMELNQKEWEMLEEYMRRYAVDNKTRISIFTGPIFSKNDPPYRDGVNLPLEFWKIVTFIKNGKLNSAGYIKSQVEWIDDLEDERLKIDPDAIKTWQLPIKEIQKLTHLTFDSQIVKADIYKENGVSLEESLAAGKEFKGRKLISSSSDVGF